MMTAMRLVSKARAAHTCARHKHIVSAHDATGLHTRTGAEAERVPTGKPSTARRSRRSTRPGDVHLRVRQHTRLGAEHAGIAIAIVETAACEAGAGSTLELPQGR